VHRRGYFSVRDEKRREAAKRKGSGHLSSVPERGGKIRRTLPRTKQEDTPGSDEAGKRPPREKKKPRALTRKDKRQA